MPEIDANVMRTIRHLRGVSAEILSAHTGLLPTTIHTMECTNLSVRPSTVKRLAEALNVQPETLLAERSNDRDRQTRR
jgi:transcriptional regulator with XRE-family HTH domain